MKKRILSGMRPTGRLHLGHLVGALNNWVRLQDEYECFFMIADWHALMSEYENPKEIKNFSIEVALDWIATGIDPDKSTIFVQSAVKEHLELYSIFSDLVPLSWLERCPTYKEQLREVKGRDLTTYGFLGYPVLQAADILVYKAQAVPVGVDQLPHLELTREIADRFNNLYKEKFFPRPQAILTQMPKLLGIDNRKMSKTFDNYIALSDEPGIIRKKAMQMITDPKRVKRSDPGHPDKCNVCSYYKVFKPAIYDEVVHNCKHALTGCTDCKTKLADVLIEVLEPIQMKRKELASSKEKIYEILNKGACDAQKVAAKCLSEVKHLIGILE